MKILQKPQSKEYTDLRNSLIKIYDEIADSKVTTNLEDVKKIHKRAIVIKAFDLVSIAMSFMGYLQFKSEPNRYYKALCTISDAKYLATSYNSHLALKVNYYILALIEFAQNNNKNAINLIQGALQIKPEEDYNFDEKIMELKLQVELIGDKNEFSKKALKLMQNEQEQDPLMTLLKVGRIIAVETNIDNLLNIMTQEIKVALNADRCTVFLLDKEKDELWSKVALGMDTHEIRFKSNMGLAGYVATTGQIINIQEAYEDPRFNKQVDQQTGYKTKTMLCMPIKNMSHEIVGVFQVLNKRRGTFTEKDEDLLLAIGSSAGIALENATLFNKQQKLLHQQKELLTSFIDTLSASIDARDKITSGHSKRVTMYVKLICEALDLPESDKELILQASLLHDIGKIGIKDSILQKEGKLTEEEYKHIQEHAKITHDILGKIYLSQKFREVTRIASTHHEKYDGTGYYQKLKGENIPLGGRILAVGDVFDAITSKRHYRLKMEMSKALAILVEGSNKHFDKKIVDAFLSVSADKIIEVLLTDTKISLKRKDKEILSKCTMKHLHDILTQKTQENVTEEDVNFAVTFSKYY